MTMEYIPWKISPKIINTLPILIIWWHRRLACADAG
jgi:hypothetical protein